MRIALSRLYLATRPAYNRPILQYATFQSFRPRQLQRYYSSDNPSSTMSDQAPPEGVNLHKDP